MTNRPLLWVKDVKVFSVTAGISLVLTCALVPLAPHLDGCGYPRVAEGLILVIAAPAWAVREFGAGDHVFVLLALNPLIYGLLWWGVWRIVKLLRGRSAD